MGDSFGMVNHQRSGLPCRADIRCDFVAQVLGDLMSTLTDAAGRRDAHERNAHEYTHIPDRQANYSFSARMTSQGRSTLGRRKRSTGNSGEDDAA